MCTFVQGSALKSLCITQIADILTHIYRTDRSVCEILPAIRCNGHPCVSKQQRVDTVADNKDAALVSLLYVPADRCSIISRNYVTAKDDVSRVFLVLESILRGRDKTPRKLAYVFPLSLQCQRQVGPPSLFHPTLS